MAEEQQAKKKGKIRLSTKKRQRQNATRRLANRSKHAAIRTAIRSFRESIQTKDQEKQKAALQSVYSLVDKAVKANLFKKNKANRIKSRLMTALCRVA